jgi:hypothetical protein
MSSRPVRKAAMQAMITKDQIIKNNRELFGDSESESSSSAQFSKVGEEDSSESVSDLEIVRSEDISEKEASEEVSDIADSYGENENDKENENALSDDEDLEIVQDVKKSAHKLTDTKVVPGVVEGSTPVSKLSTKTKKNAIVPSKILTTQEKKTIQYERETNPATLGSNQSELVAEMKKKYEEYINTNKIPGVAQMRNDYGLLHGRETGKDYNSYKKQEMIKMLATALGIPYEKSKKAKK